MTAFLTIENTNQNIFTIGKKEIVYQINITALQDRPTFNTFASAQIPPIPFNTSQMKEEGFTVRELFIGVNKMASPIDSDGDNVGKSSLDLLTT